MVLSGRPETDMLNTHTFIETVSRVPTRLNAHASRARKVGADGGVRVGGDCAAPAGAATYCRGQVLHHVCVGHCDT